MMKLFPDTSCSKLFFETDAWQKGYQAVAGVDEAGRGPLAGPVVSAAVILPRRFDLPGLNDSKQLTAAKREQLYPLIRAQSVALGVGVSRVEEIDRTNILQATLMSMVRAVSRLQVMPDYLLVDGINAVPLALPQETVKKGDSRSFSIAAASVVAKVVRDRLMETYDQIFPGYGFARHKGYGSQQHRDVIASLGPSPCHRRTFRGVREYCPAGQDGDG
ncbi:MAG: ribonuclease HII [Deltaproteobacteria bacterium]|jgi:ribonuclease HII|nr:ribonuclease HII [Deltaproteobacteria bacterium]